MGKGIEFELGPLWERALKREGFRLSIPDPVELYYWTVLTAKKFGDSTPEEINSELDEYFARFASRKSEKLDPCERHWRLNINNDLISDIEVVLRAAYSPASGEWRGIYCNINLVEGFIKRGGCLLVASKASEITRMLVKKGLNTAKLLVERNRFFYPVFYSIHIPNKSGTSRTDIPLGYRRLKDALRDGEENPAGDGIMIHVDKLSPNLIGFLADCQNFQYATSNFIDSMYQTLGSISPDATLELSNKHEVS